MAMERPGTCHLRIDSETRASNLASNGESAMIQTWNGNQMCYSLGTKRMLEVKGSEVNSRELTRSSRNFDFIYHLAGLVLQIGVVGVVGELGAITFKRKIRANTS